MQWLNHISDGSTGRKCQQFCFEARQERTKRKIFSLFDCLHGEGSEERGHVTCRFVVGRVGVEPTARWKTISMVLRYAQHQPESLRGGAEVLDRLRRENSTVLAQRVVASSGALT